MRDSLGSVVVLTIIVVFVVIVSAYMAFNVNYTKAFRMKNRIISLYEEYDGKCFSTGECETKIRNYAKEIGYNPSVKSCETKNMPSTDSFSQPRACRSFSAAARQRSEARSALRT